MINDLETVRSPLNFPDTRFDVVGFAASIGGLPTLGIIFAALPQDFPAAITVVQHVDPKHGTMMAEILSKRTKLLVRQAVDGDVLAAGTIYTAPPDFHLLVKTNGTLSLSQSARIHFLRPRADLLFESLAAAYGVRAIAVVLTGSGVDGSAGIGAIKRGGGTVIVQDTASAAAAGMPQAAIDTGYADLVLPLSEIAPALTRLTGWDSQA